MEYAIPLSVPLQPVPSGRQQLTVDNTAGGVTLTVPDAAVAAHARLETGQIRFTLDSTAPTTTVGQLLEVGETLLLESRDELTGFKAIRTGATSGVLDVEFFRSRTAAG